MNQSQNKIYVGNLSYDVTSDELQDFFGQYGETPEVKLITDFGSGRSKGFAFITFANQQQAQASLAANGVELKGRTMKVNLARDRDNNRRRGAGGNGRRSHHRQFQDDYRDR